MQQEQARLSGDGDADLVRQLKPTDSLEVLLRQEYLGVSEQLRLVVGRETVEDWQIALEDHAPCRRDGLSAQASTPAGLEEIEDHYRRLHADTLRARLNLRGPLGWFRCLID